MLLSQQAELISIQSNMIEIGLAPNWENMIKSRAVVIENAVKKIFGEHMTISFRSKTNNKIEKSDKKNNIENKLIDTQKLKDSQVTDSKIIRNEDSSDKSLDLEKNSSRNLADFFNGQIVDTE
tara:strand:- start:167 stop:535 length:369 start_codon:yes stop_codon:yes gene_type:complete